jgi:hypothetical protein
MDMRRSVDTSLAARQRQIAAYRAMTPERRLRLAEEMSADVRALAEAGGRARATSARDDLDRRPQTFDDR